MVTGNDNVTAVYPTSENEQYHSLYINKGILTMFDKQNMTIQWKF